MATLDTTSYIDQQYSIFINKYNLAARGTEITTTEYKPLQSSLLDDDFLVVDDYCHPKVFHTLKARSK